MTKPFSMRILLKKIDVILKRSAGGEEPDYSDGYLRIDFDKTKVLVNGGDARVTPTEFRLLRLFLTNRGQLLLERLWDNDG